MYYFLFSNKKKKPWFGRGQLLYIPHLREDSLNTHILHMYLQHLSIYIQYMEYYLYIVKCTLAAWTFLFYLFKQILFIQWITTQFIWLNIFLFKIFSFFFRFIILYIIIVLFIIPILFVYIKRKTAIFIILYYINIYYNMMNILVYVQKSLTILLCLLSFLYFFFTYLYYVCMGLLLIHSIWVYLH